jgi:hypothetical protein
LGETINLFKNFIENHYEKSLLAAAWEETKDSI